MKKVAVLIENNFEESELLYPYHRLREEFEVTLVGTEADTEYVGKHGGLTVKSDKASSEVSADDFDGVYIPGGFSPDGMRKQEATVKLVTDLCEADKVVAAVCHAGWVLVEANILEGKKVTSVPTIRTDIENAGANWVDEETVVDGNIITARTPVDLQAHLKAVIKALS